MTWIWIHITKWRENNVMTGTYSSIPFLLCKQKNQYIGNKMNRQRMNSWLFVCQHLHSLPSGNGAAMLSDNTAVFWMN